PTSPPLSVTATLTGYTPAAANVCEPFAVPEPFDSVTVPDCAALPSPKVHDAVCESVALASVKLALTESVAPTATGSFAVIGPTTGATGPVDVGESKTSPTLVAATIVLLSDRKYASSNSMPAGLLGTRSLRSLRLAPS